MSSPTVGRLFILQDVLKQKYPNLVPIGVEAVELLVKQEEAIRCADNLRAAQRTYLADRTQDNGAAVGEAARLYDDARLALPNGPHGGEA